MTSAGKGWTRRRFMTMTTAATLGLPAVLSGARRGRRVVVLGVDGMDPGLVRRFAARGLLPNISRLARAGTFARLGTTDPPQSPVAWSTFISGTNPGGHGIFDFIARDPRTRVPHLSTSRVASGGPRLVVGPVAIPLGGVTMENLRRGPTLWDQLDAHGVPATVFKVPANFPPSPTDARTLSGLGTPDVTGGYGTFTLFTDRESEPGRTVSGGRIVRVEALKDRLTCPLEGPSNPFATDRAPATVDLTVVRDHTRDAIMVRIGEERTVLEQGQWSPWLTVSFRLLPGLASVSGIVRLYLKRARDPFELYVTPVNIDPRDPALPLSTPGSWARELADELGLFYTQGMPEDTAALSAGVFDDDEYRNQATMVLDERVRAFEYVYHRFTEGLLFFYFSSLDLDSHMFWRAMDPRHRSYTPELARRHGDFIPWLYRRIDRVVGEVARSLGPEDTLIVLSDHGFKPFYRQFDLNAWLMDSGYVVPRDPLSRGEASYFGNVDWSRTRAYGLGINGLYLNLAGREAGGIVRPGEEARSLQREIAARLVEVRDPANGRPVVSRVLRPDRVYSGPWISLAPDLLVCYHEGYRASWDTILGRFPMVHVSDNLDPWSGDHALDSRFMQGVLLSNRGLAQGGPTMEDLAPTILALFGVPRARGMTGRVVLGGAAGA